MSDRKPYKALDWLEDAAGKTIVRVAPVCEDYLLFFDDDTYIYLYANVGPHLDDSPEIRSQKLDPYKNGALMVQEGMISQEAYKAALAAAEKKKLEAERQRYEELKAKFEND